MNSLTEQTQSAYGAVETQHASSTSSKHLKTSIACLALLFVVVGAGAAGALYSTVHRSSSQPGTIPNGQIFISTDTNDYCPGSRIGSSFIYMKGECAVNTNFKDVPLTIHQQSQQLRVRVDNVLTSQDKFAGGVVLHVCADAADCVKTVFESFCAFGAGAKGEPMMDQAKFGKLFRDLKFYNKRFTETDTDIIFNRPEVKAKTDRKITYKQFLKALELVAGKWAAPGTSTSDAVTAAETKICAGKGPSSDAGTKAGKGREVSTSKYGKNGGADESGKGSRTIGRRDTEQKPGYVGGYKKQGSYSKTHALMETNDGLVIDAC